MQHHIISDIIEIFIILWSNIYQKKHEYRKSSIKPLGGYFFQTHLIKGLIEMGGLFNLTNRITYGISFP